MKITYETNDSERIRGILAATAARNAELERQHDADQASTPLDDRVAFTPITAEEYVTFVLDGAADSYAIAFPPDESPEAVKLQRDTLRQDKVRLEAEVEALRAAKEEKAADVDVVKG